MTSLATSRMAAKMGIQQVEILRDSDRIGDEAEAHIQSIWKKIKDILWSKSPHRAHEAAKLAAMIVPATMGLVGGNLEGMAAEIREKTIRDIIDEVPLAVLASLMPMKTPVSEARRKATPAQDRQIRAMLFDEPSDEEAAQIVYGRHPQGDLSWRHRIVQQTGMATPAVMAAIITQAAARGETPDQMARSLLPHVQGVQATARRIARTESARIANETRMRAFDDMGDAVAGFQIHATLDWRTRPEHAARSGTIYWKAPKRGQKGLDQMPRPPLEADGTVAHNCRCYLSPVFKIDPAAEREPVVQHGIKDKNNRLVPDPTVYQEWFKTASHQDRVYAVGASRIAAAQERLKGSQKLDWAHFIDPRTGSLLSADSIERERSDTRLKRIRRNRSVFAWLKRLISKVARTGIGS